MFIFEGEWLYLNFGFVIELSKWGVGSVVVRFRGELGFGKKRLILLLIFITVRD